MASALEMNRDLNLLASPSDKPCTPGESCCSPRSTCDAASHKYVSEAICRLLKRWQGKGRHGGSSDMPLYTALPKSLLEDRSAS